MLNTEENSSWRRKTIAVVSLIREYQLILLSSDSESVVYLFERYTHAMILSGHFSS